MSAPVIHDERAEARRLRDEGKSEREIATSLGRAPSTIHEWLKEPPADDPDPIPGQQTIDGREIPAASQNGSVHVEEIRVDGTTQLGLIDFGGKKPQSAVVTLTGGQLELLEGRAFKKGDRIRFAGEAVVFEVGARDKTDSKTGIVVSAKQKHSARIADAVFAADTEALIEMLFCQLVNENRQKAAKLADDLVVASGQ